MVGLGLIMTIKELFVYLHQIINTGNKKRTDEHTKLEENNW